MQFVDNSMVSQAFTQPVAYLLEDNRNSTIERYQSGFYSWKMNRFLSILLILSALLASAESFATRNCDSRTAGIETTFSKGFGKKHSVLVSRGNFESKLYQSTSDDALVEGESGFSYGKFAMEYPFANNIAIATAKTALADLIAQVVIAQTPIAEIDYERSLLFCGFGALYLGGFQYLYQVNIFKKLFDVDAFTSQPWKDKLKDEEGLKALAAQTALDLTVLTLIYLPTFYIFKAGVFSGSVDPAVWTSSGLETYQQNFAKDEFDLIRVWLPADLVCFSVPLYLRLPVRHIVSFVWTAYLSFARGGH